MTEPCLTADEIVSVLSTGDPVPHETVKEWTRSEDIEVLGAIYYRIAQAPHPMSIEPPLTLDEYNDFFLRYIGLCLREHPEGEWAEDRVSAGRLWCGWFKRFWRRNGPSNPLVQELKRWLAGYYRDADDDLRSSVVVFLLEHLLEDPDIAAYFTDWQEDHALAEGYEQAMEWARCHHPPQKPTDEAAGDERR